MQNMIVKELGITILKLALYAGFFLIVIIRDVSSLTKKLNFKVLKRGTS